MNPSLHSDAGTFLFEISWEVANMVGGIHTVLASKAEYMRQAYDDRYVVVGPGIWQQDRSHPVFLPEDTLPDWVAALHQRGLSAQMGRWDVPGKPRCLLVDFSEIYKDKDQILTWLWENYQVDSIFGSWDYVEPVLYGYAAGQVIESLCESVLFPQNHPVVSQWHEWMVGSGLLYLKKKLPSVGSVFTTHATILGRSYCGSGNELPKKLTEEEASIQAQGLGIAAKHSLERKSAWEADCFTTVSQITGLEAEMVLGRTPDLLLPNALGKSFPHPMYGQDDNVQASRAALFHLAELTTGKTYDRENTLILMSSGRYEYVNKGINLVVDALADIRRLVKEKNKTIICFMCFPAGVSGPNRNLLSARRNEAKVEVPEICTHELQDPQHDPLLKHLNSHHMANNKDDSVHVIFTPIYLDGQDQLVARSYFELLPAFDLTLYPSHYEPWGYTPMESLRYGVPTVTTDLTGFGQWLREQGEAASQASFVLPRQQASYESSRKALEEHLVWYINASKKDLESLKSAARTLAAKSQWEHFGPHYEKAHQIALDAGAKRRHVIPSEKKKIELTQANEPFKISEQKAETCGPRLRSFTVESNLPESLNCLRDLAYNLWWTWNPDAQELFASLDPVAWESCGHNPIALLEILPQKLLDEKSKDQDFLRALQQLTIELKSYLEKRFQSEHNIETAYFCMEYGLHECLPFYSGGLGVLAGDHLKATSDSNLSLIALGLAYNQGYFRQLIDKFGNQLDQPLNLDFSILPISPVLGDDHQPLTVYVRFPGRAIAIKVWKAQVGSISLLLLDTNHPENKSSDREITSQLYGDGKDTRLQQEIILGLGGLKVLQAMKITPKTYHLNEGHAAFVVLGRVAQLMYDQNLTYQEALDFCRQTTVFTTHTPVPAGHDTFPEDLMRPYFSPFENLMAKSWEHIMGLGRLEEDRGNSPFSMTLLALRGSAHVNGVSKLHKKVSQEMFHPLIPDFFRSEVPVHGITNGIHIQTWMAPAFQNLLRVSGSSKVDENQIRNLPREDLIREKRLLKKKLLDHIRNQLEDSWQRLHDSPTLLAKIEKNLNPRALVIGFARRFVTYKRAKLLFNNLERIEQIVSKQDRPVIMLFAGKAHPKDKMAQDLIRDLFTLSRSKPFLGKILVLENYDFNLGRLMVQGCDVWLNTPRRPLEASGTSGMKSALNAGLNLSILDGWWAEAFNGKNGWAIGKQQTIENQDMQDELDADHLYALLEYEMLPAYFSDKDGQPNDDWVNRMREAMITALSTFSASRMVNEYQEHFYTHTKEQYDELSSNGYSALSEMCKVKDQLKSAWSKIQIEDVDFGDLDKGPVRHGVSVDMSVRVHHPGLDCHQIGVQLVIGEKGPKVDPDILQTYPFVLSEDENEDCIWRCTYAPEKSGSKTFGIRVVPSCCFTKRGVDLDMGLVTWA